MPQNSTFIFVFGAAIIVALALIIRRNRVQNTTVYESFSKKARGFASTISATGLLRFKATSRYEKTVQEIVSYFLTQGQTVLLVSSAPRSDSYSSVFSEAFQSGAFIIVNISASSRTDRFYLTSPGAKKEELAGKVAEISVDWLEYLSEVVEGLPKKSVLVFEPLTDLILMNGFDKTFKFIKKTIDYCVGEKIKMISFINNEAHEESVTASFDGLFTNIAIITVDGLEILK
jgi:hypothetical protein